MQRIQRIDPSVIPGSASDEEASVMAS